MWWQSQRKNKKETKKKWHYKKKKKCGINYIIAGEEPPVDMQLHLTGVTVCISRMKWHWKVSFAFDKRKNRSKGTMLKKKITSKYKGVRFLEQIFNFYLWRTGLKEENFLRDWHLASNSHKVLAKCIGSFFLETTYPLFFLSYNSRDTKQLLWLSKKLSWGRPGEDMVSNFHVF